MSDAARRAAGDFRVVLVEPAKSLNVGSVARAMTNLGFTQLHLVAASRFDRKRALVTACGAETLLKSVVLHDSLESALQDRREVVGFSGVDSLNRPNCTTLPEWLSGLAQRPAGATALVFGPERTGLRHEHLALCRWIVRIPTPGDCSSFNLAQAVLLVLYDLSKQFSCDVAAEAPISDRPTGNERFQLLRLLDATMTGSGFLRTGTPPHVPVSLRGVFSRLDLNRQEMGILLGLFGRIDSALRRNGESHPAEPTTPPRGDNANA